jgi:hypothetical protein
MSKQPERKVGENAQQRTLRLLREFNTSTAEPGYVFELHYDADGQGYILYVGDRVPSRFVFRFTDLEQLDAFLSAVPLQRMFMIREELS